MVNQLDFKGCELHKGLLGAAVFYKGSIAVLVMWSLKSQKTNHVVSSLLWWWAFVDSMFFDGMMVAGLKT